MPFFAVTMVHGPDWDPGRGIRQQAGWDAHATFMDRLVEEGFVILGGPLGNGAQAMLFVEAADPAQIQARMGADPWKSMGILRVGSIERWTIWLDGTGRRLAGGGALTHTRRVAVL